MGRKRWSPEQVRAEIARIYRRRHRAWFGDTGAPGEVDEWPLRIPLGVPTETEVSADPTAVRTWAEQWATCALPGRLERGSRRWARLGEQNLPAAWLLEGPEQLAQWCGESERWARTINRRADWMQRWGSAPGRLFDVFADYDEADFGRLLTTLEWLLANPASGLYLRQLPLLGVDTKWVEARAAVIGEALSWLRGIQDGSGGTGPVDDIEASGDGDGATNGEPSGERFAIAGATGQRIGRSVAGDFFRLTGLRPLPHRIRLLVLCAKLRAQTGGLRDIEAPLDEAAGLPLKPRAVLVVENLQTGIALPDREGLVAFIGLGRAVGVLRQLPWLRGVAAWYWGDIDTHGLEILARARGALPGLRSVLMDEATLLRYRALAVEEGRQQSGAGLEPLSAAERRVFDGLKAGRWGTRLRLEQERIPWGEVERVLASIVPMQRFDPA